MTPDELQKMVDEATDIIKFYMQHAVNSALCDISDSWLSARYLKQHDPALFRSLALGLIRDYCDAELLKMQPGTPEKKGWGSYIAKKGEWPKGAE